MLCDSLVQACVNLMADLTIPDPYYSISVPYSRAFLTNHLSDHFSGT
jgi:hypothetical protein